LITIIRGGTVVTALDDEPLTGADVVVEDALVREVSPGRSALGARADVEIYDAAGSTVLPGLIDAHTHLTTHTTFFEPTTVWPPPVTARSIAKGVLHGCHNARELIRHGVTTVRDVGAHDHGIFELQRMIDSGGLVGPRIVACGRAIAMTGGHGMNAVSADGPDEVRRLARTELAAGAGALKFMASGAGAESRQSPYDCEFTEEEMAAGVREAQAHHKTTCAHSMNPESTRNAVFAGINSIEHGLLLDDASLELMHSRSVHYVPTVWTYQNSAENGEYYGSERWMIPVIRERVDQHLNCVAKAHELGVIIGAGTDSALPVNPPESMAWEAEWLHHCGLSILESVRAATVNNALLLKLDDRIGSLAPGRIADIVVVDGSLHEDLSALLRVKAVFKNGAPVVQDGQICQSSLYRAAEQPPPGPLPPPSWHRAAPTPHREVAQ